LNVCAAINLKSRAIVALLRDVCRLPVRPAENTIVTVTARSPHTSASRGLRRPCARAYPRNFIPFLLSCPGIGVHDAAFIQTASPTVRPDAVFLTKRSNPQDVSSKRNRGVLKNQSKSAGRDSPPNRRNPGFQSAYLRVVIDVQIALRAVCRTSRSVGFWTA
jgi:hypothetical protein